MQPHHALAMHRRHIDETRALLDRHEREHVRLRLATKGVRGQAHHAMVARHNAEYDGLKGRHASEARGEGTTGAYKPRSPYWLGTGWPQAARGHGAERPQQSSPRRRPR